MEEQAPATKRRRERSPSYPGINLENAIDRAETLRQRDGRAWTPSSAAFEHWGYRPRSSSGQVALAALTKFGLAEAQGSGELRQVRLTELAMRILLDERPDSEERREAIKEAALNPAIHRELLDEFDGSLPSDSNLRFQLRANRRFTDQGAVDFIAEFRSTLEYANLGNSGTLSEPVIDKDTPSESEEPSMSPPPVSQQAPVVAQPPSQPSTEMPGNESVRAVQLPLSGTAWATLQASFPLTDDQWTQMMALLVAMKPALVEQSGDSGSTDNE